MESLFRNKKKKYNNVFEYVFSSAFDLKDLLNLKERERDILTSTLTFLEIIFLSHDVTCLKKYRKISHVFEIQKIKNKKIYK